MSTLIPDDELKVRKSLNLAPMVDFLFLILAVFSVLAVTRTALYDSDVSLVKMDTKTPPPAMSEVRPGHTVLLSINQRGEYKWVTEFNEFLLDGIVAVKQQLMKQQEMGFLPPDKSKTKILLHIDKQASWESIATLIFAVKEMGYLISPVYSPDDPL